MTAALRHTLQLLTARVVQLKNFTSTSLASRRWLHATQLRDMYRHEKRRVVRLHFTLVMACVLYVSASRAYAQSNTVTLESDASTLAASTPLNDPSLFSGNVHGLTFQPVDVGAFGTFTPIPPGAPPTAEVVNIPPGNGQSGFFMVTFTLPNTFSNIQLNGLANVDDVGFAFLNGNLISSQLTEFGNVSFSATNRQFFQPGINVLVISDNNTGGGPSGASFFGVVTYDTNNCNVTVTNVQMADASHLKVDLAGNFSQNPSSKKFFNVSTTLNGVVVSGSFVVPDGSVGAQAGSVIISLNGDSDGQPPVPRFTTNTQFTVNATEIEDQNSCGTSASAAILLPVIIVPGILNGDAGDGTFPILEDSLTHLTPANLALPNYVLRKHPEIGTCASLDQPDEAYPTLYTLSYHTNTATFADGADVLGQCIEAVQGLTHAANVNIVSHSKGGLISRQFLEEKKSLVDAAPVDQLIMAVTPNEGALEPAWASLTGNLIVRLGDLLPVWPWHRRRASAEFVATPVNKALDELNSRPLPSNVQYTILFSGSEDTDFTRTNFTLASTPGDGIVPAFSALGMVVDPNISGSDIDSSFAVAAGSPNLIPAFTGIQITNIQIPGEHLGYLQESVVMQELALILRANK